MTSAIAATALACCKHLYLEFNDMVKSIVLASLLIGAGASAAMATDTITLNEVGKISIETAVKGTNTGYIIQGGYSISPDGTSVIAERAKAKLTQIGHANTGGVIQIADHTTATVRQIVITHHRGQ